MFQERTLKSILEDPLISEISKDAISKWDLSKEEFYDWTLKDIGEKVGWRNMATGFERLFDVASSRQYYYKLYSEDERAKDPEKENINIVYLPSDDEKAADRPFILLVPGGGFVNVWSLTEGWPVAARFNKKGYNVFVLTYRVSVDLAAVKSMEDVARALQLIKSRSEEFGVDPDKYITCGFSAGGYVICLWNTDKGYRKFNLPKPQACFPIYPVTSYRVIRDTKWDIGETKDAYAQSSVGCSLEEACNSSFEVPLHVEGFPPTAIFVAAEDELVDTDHSKNLATALEEAGIKVRFEMGETGGHGFADGDGMSMEGWPERAIEFYESL